MHVLDAIKDNFYTVERWDGEVFVGQVEFCENDILAVYSGLRGRPTILAKEDITEIRYAHDNNPHLEGTAA